MSIIKETLSNIEIIDTLNYLKKYQKSIYVVGGAATSLQSNYKTKDIDLINFPYIESIEEDKNIKIIDYTYNEDSSILGFSKLLVKEVLVDIVYSDIPYKSFYMNEDTLSFVSLFGFNVLSIKSLFITSKPNDYEKREHLIKDNNLPIDFIYNFDKEDRIKFLVCWESVFGELELDVARKYLTK